MTDSPDVFIDGGNASSFSTPIHWKFEDYWGTGPTPHLYVWEVNPNDGGSPNVQKSLSIAHNTGPNRIGIVQEGKSDPPVLSFSGVILTQDHYQTLEIWFDKRILIKMTDDLGRVFVGVFSKFAPKRVRRPRNVWYHTYDAEFTATGYINASNQVVYGRVV